MSFPRAESGLPVVGGKEVQPVPVSGRLNGTLKVQGEVDTPVIATAIYFYWVKEPPYFFLRVEDEKIGMELDLIGDKLEHGKDYNIGMEPGEVEAAFKWSGSKGHYQSDKIGGLKVTSVTPEDVGGYFSFGYKELGAGFERQVDFSCQSFSFKLPK